MARLKARPLLISTLIIFSFVRGAVAQHTPQTMARAQEISGRYNSCVYMAAVNRFRPNEGIDINAAAEMAFSACATERDQMTTFLQQNGLLPEQIREVLLEKNAGIKNELRKLVLESQGIKP